MVAWKIYCVMIIYVGTGWLRGRTTPLADYYNVINKWFFGQAYNIPYIFDQSEGKLNTCYCHYATVLYAISAPLSKIHYFI